MKFELGQQIEIASGEKGKVTGRAEFLNSENTYRVHVQYKSADGRDVESWWDESALTAVEETTPAL